MATRRFQVGSDQVESDDDRLLIRTRAPMLDWPIRRYARPRVHFQDKEYAILYRDEVETKVVYHLAPWSDPREKASAEIFYDEDYVRERDHARRVDFVSDGLRPFLFPLYTVVGFLPACWKARLEHRYGLEARTATSYSVWFEGLAAFSCMVLLCITFFVAGLSGGFVVLSPAKLGIALLLLAPDTVMRADSLMRETRVPPGFYEWIFRRRSFFRELR